ncbi:transcription termination/antitermination protein NusG [Peptoanaerobacter stomatis]|uniref:transcription termination/antitermination protein NusG n=1 Tax=Peptoanaerobacter stomatis TaxID=796937 RepID=UPI003F9F5173
MFVIKVVPQKELIVKKLLNDKGYKVLCPRKIKTEGRYRKEVERIIFTGYLFVDKALISDRDYYKIRDTVDVIGFLDSKYSLSNDDEEYIRILDNNGNAIEKIDVSFDEKRKAIVYMNDGKGYISTKNVIRINARDKTITFRFRINEIMKDVTLEYNEI